MVKVKFGNYTYFDPNETDASKAAPFDKQHFDQLIANRQYLDAADYADKYHFDESDPAKDRDYRNRIINLRRRGRQLEAIYSKIGDEKDVQAVSFVDGVFLNNETVINGAGDYGEQFTKIKRGIGSTDDKEATSLKIKFYDKKQSLFGFDSLYPDNDASIENFYDTSGLSEEDLINAGINVSHQDGNTILEFSKTNGLANKILYNLPCEQSRGDLPLVDSNLYPTITGIDSEGNDIGNYRSRNVVPLKQFIDDANSTKQKYLGELTNQTRSYSSTIAPWISDELYQLQQMGLSEEEYNRQAKLVAPNVFKALNDLSSSRHQFYSDIDNPDTRDETLNPLDNQRRAEVADLIASTAPSKIQVDAMVSNGQIGAMVTLLGTTDSKTGEVKIPPKHIFIPNLLLKEAQERINMDSSYRAVQEINSMLDLQYDYKLQDGNKLRVTNDGEFFVTDKDTEKAITRDDAIRILNKDMIIEESKAELKYAYMNSDGNIFDKDGYEAKAREITLNSINDLYNDMNVVFDPTTKTTSIIDQYGRKHDPADLFNQRIDRDATQFDVYDRLNSIYDVYNQIMQDLMKYI